MEKRFFSGLYSTIFSNILHTQFNTYISSYLFSFCFVCYSYFFQTKLQVLLLHTSVNHLYSVQHRSSFFNLIEIEFIVSFHIYVKQAVFGKSNQLSLTDSLGAANLKHTIGEDTKNKVPSCKGRQSSIAIIIILQLTFSSTDFYKQTLYFEIILDSQEVAKIVQRILMVQLAFPNINILHNHNPIIKTEKLPQVQYY